MHAKKDIKKGKTQKQVFFLGIIVIIYPFIIKQKIINIIKNFDNFWQRNNIYNKINILQLKYLNQDEEEIKKATY